jgi:hypothetical protein
VPESSTDWIPDESGQIQLFVKFYWPDETDKRREGLWEAPESGMPDFSWHNIPKRGKNIPNDHTITQSQNYTN